MTEKNMAMPRQASDFHERCTEMMQKRMLGNDADPSGKLKDALIDECVCYLKQEEEQGTRQKGRTASLVSHMTGIPEYYVRSYLGAKNRSICPDKEKLDQRERASEFYSACRQMKYLSASLKRLDLAKEYLDSGLLYERINELLFVLDHDLGIHYQYICLDPEKLKEEEERLKEVNRIMSSHKCDGMSLKEHCM